MNDKQLLANQPNIVVADKEQKRAALTDVAIPAKSNIKKRSMKRQRNTMGWGRSWNRCRG